MNFLKDFSELQQKMLTCWPNKHRLKHLGFNGVVIYLVINDSGGSASIFPADCLNTGINLLPAFLSGIEKLGFLEWSIVEGYGGTL